MGMQGAQGGTHGLPLLAELNESSFRTFARLFFAYLQLRRVSHMMRVAKQYELFLQRKDQFVAWHKAKAASVRASPRKGGREARVLDTLAGLRDFVVFVKAGGGFAKFEGYPEEDSKPSADESPAATPPKIPVWDGATQAHKDAVFALISDLESVLVQIYRG